MPYKISVIIPVYNSGKSAISAINSVINQNFSCHEIIVVDDGSTDDSLSILTNYCSNIPNAHIFSIKNSGAGGARNYGILRCSGNWVAFLDSDDVWMPHKIQTQVNVLEADPSISLVGSLTSMQNFSNRSFDSHSRRIGFINLLFKNYFQPSTVIINRAILSQLGLFPYGRRFAEEGDLFLRISSKFNCILVNEVLVDYCGGKSGFGSSGLSSNIIKMEMGELNNFYLCFKRGDIGILLFFLATNYSILKFIRRLFKRYINNSLGFI
jgi:glycosyltransferase involved in cell wall biosynthesis